MTTETGLGDDLTFIRSLLKERPVQLRTTGQLYGLAGLCYGLYSLACGFTLLGWSPLGDATFWVGTLASNGVFFLGVILLSVRAKTPEGVANRALTGGFAGVGIAMDALETEKLVRHEHEDPVTYQVDGVLVVPVSRNLADVISLNQFHRQDTSG